MKLNTQERKDGIWLSKEELANLMETLTKEAREEHDEVKRAFAYGKAVLAKDLLCRIKEPEREKEHKPVAFVGTDGEDLVFYSRDNDDMVRVSMHGLMGYTPGAYRGGIKYMTPDYPEEDFDLAF